VSRWLADRKIREQGTRVSRRLHGAISQKTAFFIVTAVITSLLPTWVTMKLPSSVMWRSVATYSRWFLARGFFYLLATCSRWFFARGFFYPEDGAIRSSETSVLTRSTRHHIPEGGILHSHRYENLKSYILFITFSIDRNYLNHYVSEIGYDSSDQNMGVLIALLSMVWEQLYNSLNRPVYFRVLFT
jgi:hypothetical protein